MYQQKSQRKIDTKHEWEVFKVEEIKFEILWCVGVFRASFHLTGFDFAIKCNRLPA